MVTNIKSKILQKLYLVIFKIKLSDVVIYILIVRFSCIRKNFLLIGGCYRELIFFVILDTFLEAFCLLMIPVFAIDINSEFNFGRNVKASFLSFFSMHFYNGSF